MTLADIIRSAASQGGTVRPHHYGDVSERRQVESVTVHMRDEHGRVTVNVVGHCARLTELSAELFKGDAAPTKEHLDLRGCMAVGPLVTVSGLTDAGARAVVDAVMGLERTVAALWQSRRSRRAMW